MYNLLKNRVQNIHVILKLKHQMSWNKFHENAFCKTISFLSTKLLKLMRIDILYNTYANVR